MLKFYICKKVQMNLPIFYRTCNCKSLKSVHFLLRLYHVYISSVNVVPPYLIGTPVQEWPCGRWRRFWTAAAALRGGAASSHPASPGYRSSASWCRSWHTLTPVQTPSTLSSPSVWCTNRLISYKQKRHCCIADTIKPCCLKFNVEIKLIWDTSKYLQFHGIKDTTS